MTVKPKMPNPTMSNPDDRTPGPGEALIPRGDNAWLYTDPISVHTTERLGAVLDTLAAVEAAVQQGHHAVGYIAYEAAPAFDPALITHSPIPGLPLLWFGIYAAPRRIPWPLALELLPTLPETAWEPALSEAAYHAALLQIREHIARGDSYQVNYTFPLEADVEADPFAWFCALHARQPAEHAAYIDTGRHQVLSLSPELFLRRDGQNLRSRPMKGTRPRGCWSEEDIALAEELRHAPKDQAENVMIVDMVRNDLGHVSRPGSVSVPELFTVERYPTVWQLCSEVISDSDADLCSLMQALFPPASVTGAPKVETMRIIHRLEPEPRGVYCGAVGWMAPDGALSFNVPIRTLLYDRECRRARYAVGSGVTWDSVSDAEYAECLIKARFLHETQPDFALLESLRHDEGGYFLLAEHLERLEASMQYWDFNGDIADVEAALARYCETLPDTPCKVRLLYHRDGALHIEHAPAPPTRPITLGLALEPVDRRNRFLYHKTTARGVYDAALAAQPDCDDVLLWNEDGELTESALANLVLRLEGQWWTPPIASGLLPGTYRRYLLRTGVIQERVLHKADLFRAEEIALINAVRQWIPVSELRDA